MVRSVRGSRRAWSCVCAVVLVMGTALLGGAPAGAATKSSPRPPIKHVFVINLENKSFDETWGASSPAPYLSQTLKSQGLFLDQYFGIAHVSLGNYIAQISGQGPSKSTQGDCIASYSEFQSTGVGADGQVLGDGCVYPASVKTLADQLSAKKLTWKGYMEDMAEPCLHPEIGQKDPYVVATATSAYATRHNPFVYFHSITDAPTCAKNDVPLDAARPRPAVDQDDRELQHDHAERLQRRARRDLPRRRARWPGGREHLAADVGAQDHVRTCIQEGRHARHHVRRGRGRG